MKLNVKRYSEAALPHLSQLIKINEEVMSRVAARLVENTKAGKMLLVFGSGHSSIFTMELYHRAGGASFVLPLFADFLLPSAGPPVVRVMERTPAVANVLLHRAQAQAGEMLWLCSQSGINSAIVDLALDAKKRGLETVAFTSVAHSSAVKSRHASEKRLFEVCDHVVDLGGTKGDASLEIPNSTTRTGPLSSLGAILLGQSIIAAAVTELEQNGHRCVYTSVNTPEGEALNKSLEAAASGRDFLLRGC